MHIDLTYQYLTRHIIPGPQSWTYFVTLVLLPVALLIPRKTLSRWQSIAVFMPVMLLTTIHAWIKIDGVDVISVDVLLWAIFLLVLTNPWRDFKYLKQDSREDSGGDLGSGEESTFENEETNGLISHDNVGIDENEESTEPRQARQPTSDELPYPTLFAKRLPWVLTLLASIRLDSWKTGRRSHDKSQPPLAGSVSRKTFVARTIVGFVRGYLVLDLTRAYESYDPYFTDPSIPISTPSDIPWTSAIPPQLLRSAITGLQTWALISQLFYLPCLLPVALNALGLLSDEWSPHNWSPYFGPSRVVLLYGVRGFWSQYWHQSMRSFVSEPGYAISDVMRLRRGGLVRYAVITLIAFGLSGLIHMGLVPPEPIHATMDVNAVRLCVAGFFWTQPVAMMVEVIAIRIVSYFVPLRSCESGAGLKYRVIANGVFFITWFTLCLPLLGEAARQLGYWRVWPLPVSAWKGLRGEGWIVWPFLKKQSV